MLRRSPSGFTSKILLLPASKIKTFPFFLIRIDVGSFRIPESKNLCLKIESRVCSMEPSCGAFVRKSSSLSVLSLSSPSIVISVGIFSAILIGWDGSVDLAIGGLLFPNSFTIIS